MPNWPKGSVASTRHSHAITPAVGFSNPCPTSQDFLYLLRKRQTRWLNASYVLEHGLWQRAIDDKLLGYIYARSVGVATPSVLFCDPRGPLFLPEEWPTEWGCCFAIKPLYGFLTDGLPIFGYRRKPYLIIAGLLGSSAWASLATVVELSKSRLKPGFPDPPCSTASSTSQTSQQMQCTPHKRFETHTC